MALKSSRLFPQVKYWDEDLPEITEEQRVYPRLIRVNEINDIWMEIPRYVNHGWGGLWFFAFVALMPLCILFISINDLGFLYNSYWNIFFFIHLYLSAFVLLSDDIVRPPRCPRALQP